MDNQHIAKLLPKYLSNSQTYFVVVFNLDGKYVYVNETFRNKYSFLAEDMTNFSFHGNIHPDDVEKCYAAIKTFYSTPNAVIPIRVRRLTENPKEFYWINWELSVFWDEQRQPMGVLCIGQDISKVERLNKRVKKISKRAQALSKNVNTIVENIKDGFYMLNHHWEIIKVNQTALNMAGVSKEQLLRKKFWDIFPPSTENSNYELLLHKAMSEYNTVAFDNYSTRFDQWFHIVAYPSLQGLNIFFRDITQEKKTQEALKASYKKLREIAVLQSHIVRRPVANILGIANLIKDNPDASETELRQCVDYLYKATQELDEVVHQITANTTEIENITF